MVNVSANQRNYQNIESIISNSLINTKQKWKALFASPSVIDQCNIILRMQNEENKRKERNKPTLSSSFKQLLSYLLTCTPKRSTCHNNNRGVRIHINKLSRINCKVEHVQLHIFCNNHTVTFSHPTQHHT